MPGLQIARALRHTNFRRFFVGQLASLSGSWVQQTAQAWLVYRLTDSSLWLGLVAFVGLLPVLLFGILAGSVADRVSRYRLLLVVHSVALLQAIVLAVLTLTGNVTVFQVMLLAVLLGTTQAFEMPARQAFIAELVPRADLPNAIALNSAMFNAARFIGPALAGVIIATAGEGWAFALNAASFAAIVVALLSMSDAVRAPRTQAHHVGDGFWSGLHHVRADPLLRGVILMVMMVSLVGLPFSLLMPVVARDIYGGTAGLLGALLAANGAGAFCAALWLAAHARTEGRERVIGAAALGAGTALLLFAWTPPPALALLLMAATGFAFTTLIASCNTALQLRAPDRLRGRVMALFSVLFVGLFPIGNLLSGSLAEWLGPRPVIALFGGCCLLAGTAYLLRRRFVASS
ncbi:MAG: MFS transporter [Gammaproteobacteria bacterium]|nr:MAG: MFS transporter [Gammaproteobacteria bacterium]